MTRLKANNETKMISLVIHRKSWAIIMHAYFSELDTWQVILQKVAHEVNHLFDLHGS